MLPTTLNIADANDHVPQAERSIRAIKDRARCTVQGLPFQKFPRILTQAIVESANRSFNQFRAKDGASITMSPLTILTGKPRANFANLKLELGQYVQVFEDNDPSNTNKTRTTGAIALNPSDNAQGGYTFLSLVTGRKLSRQQWDELPMPQGVIERVEQMAVAENRTAAGRNGLHFEWSPGIPIQDEPQPHIAEAPPPRDEDAEEGWEDDENIPHDGDEDDNIPDPQHQPVTEEDSDQSSDDLYDQDDAPDTEDDHTASEEDDPGSKNSDAEHDEQFLDEGVPDEEQVPEQGPAQATGHDDQEPQAKKYGLRPNRDRDYGFRLDRQMDDPENNKSYKSHQFLQDQAADEDNRPTPYEETVKPHTLREAVENRSDSSSHPAIVKGVVGILLNQMSAKVGIKKHGKVAIEAIFDEFLQFHDLDVFKPRSSSSLTKEQKKAALRAISVIKEKRCGKIKGRTVADGRAQKGLYGKEKTASPTVSTDALMMSILIDAWEKRDVATADVSGAYLRADMTDFTILRIEGEEVHILCQVHEKYRNFVVMENGKQVLYLELLKALYGCVQSALLWYNLFTGTLQSMGFKLNPYDPCVANLTIHKKQCTVAWFVDDNKISHADCRVVTKVIKKIEAHFGKMTVTRGTHHVFLGMNITYQADGTASIGMKDYIQESIDDFPDELSKGAATPSRRTLFEIDPDSPKLNETRSEMFHSIVAKQLYVSHRGRPDVQLPIAFLCTRVSKSTEQDWSKLKRVLEFLKGTLDDRITLGADDITIMQTWVDASYAVHSDMKSHTGGTVSFGRGSIMSKSSKQKLNTKSSTEAELVGASDYLSYAIWAKKFLECQGYILSGNAFHQDNKSTIQFEKNGRKSCGPNSRHIDIRYFWIKDRLDLDGFDVVYCPTERMLADFFTKPLQGALFRKLRAVVMGHAHVRTLLSIEDKSASLTEPTVVPPGLVKERVGRKRKGKF